MKKKVFIIEDDANILFALQAKLSLAGFEVDLNNGSSGSEEVLNKMRTYQPDYIILDLVLPKIDGFAIAKAIRADDSLSSAKVFIFTSLSDSDSRSMGANYGVKYYFIKNELSVDDFISRFLKIINNQS